MAAPVKVSPPLAAVRSGAIAWEPLGTHGLRRCLLGYDPATGHATSVVEIPKGWRGGGIAHFHEAFEEVYMLSGSVTLDGRNYWHGGEYFYRPAHIVHGHDERSEEGAIALIRSDGPLELLLVHDPVDPDEYPLPEMNDPRGHLKSLTVADVVGVTDPAFPGWSIRPLSADAVGGARTVIADVPANWSGAHPPIGVAWEAFVLSGAIQGRAATYATGDYTAGGSHDALLDAERSESGCSILIWLFGRE